MKFVLTVLFSTCVLEATEVAHCKMNLKCLFVNENPGKTTRVLSRGEKLISHTSSNRPAENEDKRVDLNMTHKKKLIQKWS